MTATYITARGEIFQTFLTAWNANTPAVNGGVIPEIRWQGVESRDTPPTNAAWAHIFITHEAMNQQTLGETGNRRFERRGMVTVVVNTPLSLGQGLTLNENLATIAKDAFEGISTANAIWFRDVLIKEVGADPEGPWFVTHITAEFRYDELK